MPEEEKKKRGIWSRRDFFTRLGWAGFGIFGGLSLLGFLRSAFPRVLFQPPLTFKAGSPSDYAIGEVSEKVEGKNLEGESLKGESFQARNAAPDQDQSRQEEGRRALDRCA